MLGLFPKILGSWVLFQKLYKILGFCISIIKETHFILIYHILCLLITYYLFLYGFSRLRQIYTGMMQVSTLFKVQSAAVDPLLSVRSA